MTERNGGIDDFACSIYLCESRIKGDRSQGMRVLVIMDAYITIYSARYIQWAIECDRRYRLAKRPNVT